MPQRIAERTISAAWLGELVRNGVISVRIEITHAIVTGELDLRGIAFEQDVKVRDSEFEQPVNWSGADFKRAVSFARSRFVGEAVFDGIRIDGLADFRGVNFDEKAEFVAAELGVQAIFLRAVFGRGVHFNDARGRTITFAGAQFWGDATFDRMTVDGPVVFGPEPTPGEVGEVVRFNGGASFIRCHVKDQADFRSAEFRNDVSFDEAHFDDNVYFGQYDTGMPATRFMGEASFAAVKAESDVYFDGAVFHGGVRFDGARFRNIFFRLGTTASAEHPQFQQSVDFSGCEMQSIFVAWRELIGAVRPARDLPRVLGRVEQTLRADGRGRDADAVYYEARALEMRELWKTGDVLRALIASLHGAIAGYGVRPYRLVAVVVFFLVAGTLIFSLPRAVTHREASLRFADPYRLDLSSAIGVSVNQFFPGDLPAGKRWQPSAAPIPIVGISFAGYATIHRIASVALIPLIIAFIRDVLNLKKSV